MLYLKNRKKYPYPENLMSCVLGQDRNEMVLPPQLETMLTDLFSNLEEKDISILEYYFNDNFNIKEIAELQNSTYSHIHQALLSAIHKMQLSLPVVFSPNLPTSLTLRLYYANIKTIGDLTAWTEKQLLCLYYVGQKSIEKIKESLGLLGLSLTEEVLEPDNQDKEDAHFKHIHWRDVQISFTHPDPQDFQFSHYSDAELTELISEHIIPHNDRDDPFWERAEVVCLNACVFYLRAEAEPFEQNLINVFKLMHCGLIPENREIHESSLARLFKTLKAKAPEHPAVRYYEVFESLSDKLMLSILISCSIRLSEYLKGEKNYD